MRGRGRKAQADNSMSWSDLQSVQSTRFWSALVQERHLLCGTGRLQRKIVPQGRVPSRRFALPALQKAVRFFLAYAFSYSRSLIDASEILVLRSTSRHRTLTRQIRVRRICLRALAHSPA